MTLECLFDLDERPETIKFDLKQPFWIRKRITGTKRHGSELREGHCIQYGEFPNSRHSRWRSPTQER